MRDESDGRLVVRVCAVDSNLNARNLLMGLIRDGPTGGKGIAETTKEIIKRFFSQNFGAPHVIKDRVRTEHLPQKS